MMNIPSIVCEHETAIAAVVDPLDEAVNEVFGVRQSHDVGGVDMIQLMLLEPDFGIPVAPSQSVPPVPSSPTVTTTRSSMQKRPALVSMGSMTSFQRSCASTASMSSLQSTVSKRSTSTKTVGSTGKPKRALSAYNIYFTTERKKLTVAQAKEGSPKLSFREIACKIAGMWKKISQEEKMEYEYLAAQDTDRYENEMAQWKASRESLASLQQPPSSQQDQQAHGHHHWNASWSEDSMHQLRLSQDNIFF